MNAEKKHQMTSILPLVINQAERLIILNVIVVIKVK